MSKLWYVAHPFIDDPEGNVKQLIYICNLLLDAGYKILSPITHCYPLHLLRERENEFWYELSMEYLKRCDGLILCIGWQYSVGCLNEYKYATEHNLEVKHIKDCFTCFKDNEQGFKEWITEVKQ